MKDDNQVDDLNLDEMDQNANGDGKQRHGCATAFIIVTVLGSLYNIIAFITGQSTKQLEMAAAQLRMAEMYEEAEGMDRMIDAMQAPGIMPMGVISALLIVVGRKCLEFGCKLDDLFKQWTKASGDRCFNLDNNRCFLLGIVNGR